MDWAVLGFWVCVVAGFALLRWTSIFDGLGGSAVGQHDPDRSIYGDKRLSRDDAHLWADRVEHGLRQLNRRIRTLTFLTMMLVGYLAFQIITGR